VYRDKGGRAGRPFYESGSLKLDAWKWGDEPATGCRAPLVHAATKAARKAFYDAYAWFVAAFRQAAEKLRQGDRNAAFPAGSFPPALPFVSG
jgi:hypothetical protein